MKLEYIYSACVLISTEDCKILCDPWFTPGAFGGTWFHFPYKKTEPKDIGFCDYVYVSHIHTDHYDHIWLKDYLKVFPKSKVIIADWSRINPLSLKMKRDNIKNVEVTNIDHKNTNITLFPHDNGSPSDIDSALIVTTSKGQVVNMNDCIWDRNFYEKINNFSNDINKNHAFKVGLFSYTGAGAYPHTYWYGKDELKEKSEIQKNKLLEHYKSKTNILKCDMNIPFAGQFLLGGESSKYNEFRGICDATEVYKFDSKACVLEEYKEGFVDLNIGSAVGVRKNKFDNLLIKERIKEISLFKPDFEKKISSSLASEIRIKTLVEIAFKKAFKRLNSKIDYCYYLNIENKEFYTLDLKKGLITEGIIKIKDLEVITHEIYIQRNLLISLLLGIEHWDNAEKGSMYMSLRNPDKFIRKAQSFLHFFCI